MSSSANVPALDWAAIARAAGIIVGVTGAFGLIVPPLGAIAVNEYVTFFPDWTTLNISGSEFYQIAFWMIAAGLTLWQGGWMLKNVGTAIVNDMLVTSAIAAGVLVLIIRPIIWLAYEPTSFPQNEPQWPVTQYDAAGALLLIIVALIAGRINQD